LNPRSIEENFKYLAESKEYAACLAEIDKDQEYRLLMEDIAPSLKRIRWYQEYEQLDSLIRFIDERDMESYCAFKFKIFFDDYDRKQYCEAIMNVKPKPVEFCNKHP